MRPEALIAALLALPDENARQLFLETHHDELTADVSAALERQADHLRLQNPRAALQSADALLQIATHLADEHARANALRLKGNLSLHLGRYHDSLAFYSQAREIRAHYGETLEIARLQVGWTAALKNLARYEEALQLALTTREILVEHQKWDLLANLELNIGSIYRHTDRYDEALATFEQSRQNFMRVGNPVGAAQAQVNASRALGCQDRFREALSLLHQARSVFEPHGKWMPLARTDLNLAILSFWLGHYREAWEGFSQARETFRRLDNEMEVAIVDLYGSRVYLSLNLFPEALDLARSARPVFADRGMARHVALADLNQGIAQRWLGEEAEALRLFHETRAFFVAHNGVTRAALVDLERAALLRSVGRPAEALSVAQEASAIFSRSGLSVRRDQARLLMAECYSDLDQADQAGPLYRTILDVPCEQRLPTLAYRAHYGLGRLEEAQVRHRAAFERYQAAVQEIETIRRTLRVDEFKASFLDDKLSLYQAAVRLSLEMGHVEQALDYVERSKSSALLDLLARDLELRTANSEAADAQAWEKLRALREEWLWHYTKLEGLPVEEPDDKLRAHVISNSEAMESGESKRAWVQLRRVEAQLSQVLRQLQGQRYSTLSEDEGRAWKAVEHHLEPDVLLIVYFGIGDKILAFLLNTDGLAVCQDFPYSLREVRRSLSVLDLALKGTSGLDPGYIRTVLGPLAQRHLHWLHSALIAPLSTSIDGYRKLIIVPHDALYYLPFHAFHDGQSCLIDRFEVQYAPSVAVLARCYQTKKATSTTGEARPALVMGYSDGDRLQHVPDEVQAVARALKRGSEGLTDLVFQEQEATLASLRAHAGHCRLLHLASHAVFRSDNPLFSSIRLADEPLNVIDIYHLNLSASLVTLSACETGMSQLKGGDLFGLARGCLYAGAPTLVVSLWQVDDDSTALLMAEFYRRLQAGERVASALRLAQLSLRQVERAGPGGCPRLYEHPHYWAPFVLIGADGLI